MKFKKFLALSLAAAMMTTGIPGVGMLDGAVNVMAEVTGTTWEPNSVTNISDENGGVKIENIKCTNENVTLKDGKFVYTVKEGEKPDLDKDDFEINGLTKTSDYTVEITDEGKSVTFERIGTYSGTVSFELDIVPETPGGGDNEEDEEETTITTQTGDDLTLNGAEVNLNVSFSDKAVYTGKDLKPDAKKIGVVAADKEDGEKTTHLTYGTDYTVSYYKVVKSGNKELVGDKVTSIVDAGKYFVAITGKGQCSGVMYCNFEVTARPLTEDNTYVSLNSVGYSGKKIAASVGNVVCDINGEKVTLSASDYKVAYANENEDSRKPGVHEITLEGTGNFSGEPLTSANVFSADGKTSKPLDLTLTIVKSISNGDVFLKEDINGISVVGASGSYTLEANNSVMSEDNIKVDSWSLNGGEGVDDLDYRELKTGDVVTAKVSGVEANGFTGSATATYTVNKEAIKLNDKVDYTGEGKTEVSIIQNAIYTGEPTKPSISVLCKVKDSNGELKDKVLTEGVDYVTYYEDNIDVGTGATVTVIGRGKYCDSVTKSFEVFTNSFATGTVSAIPSAIYTGAVQEVKKSSLTITDNTGKLIPEGDIGDLTYYKVKTDEDGDLVTDPKGKYGYAIDDKFGADDKPKDAGTYVVEIELSGNYAGSAALYQTYTINPASIATGFKFTTGNNVGSYDNFKKDYTGKIASFDVDKECSLVQLDEEGDVATTLGEDDFTVETPKDACEVGEYAGIVKGTGNYTGEIPFTFKIVKTLGTIDIAFDAEETKVNDKVSYTYTPITLVKEKVNNGLLAKNTDYEVSYYYYTAVSKDKADFTIGETSYALVGGKASSFKSGQDYVAVVNGISEYEGTEYVLFKVPDVSTATSLKDATVTFTKDFMAVDKYTDEYTGSAVTVGGYGSSNAIAVRVGNKLLIQGTDFEVTYNNNINVSKDAEIIIVGKGKYYGTVSAKFEITQKVMSNSKIEVSTGANDGIGEYCYTGKALEANIKVKDNDLGNLTEGVDYEVSYANIVSDGNSAKKDANGNYIKGDAIAADKVTEVGSYLVVIKGIGNYTSEVTQLVKIDKLNLASSGDDVTIKGNDMVATGEEITPTFTFINKANGSEFSIDASNYTLKLYADKACKEPVDSVTEVGTYYAKLKGTNNATGTSDAIEFNVVEGKDITDADITVLDSTENPKLIVIVDGKVLEADKDYTVEYVVGEDGKTGTAIVTGAGEYAGTATATYEIKKEAVALSKASIKLTKTSYGYNGKAKKPGVTVKVDGVKVDPSEYTVSYSDNKNAGTGKVTIIANDDSEVIKGSKTMTITIAKASNKVTASNVTKSYKVKTLKAKKATFKLSAKAKAGKISYKKVSSGKKITVSKNGTVTVAKGLKKGTYKVKVKVTAASSTNYKAASKTMTVTVKVK